MLPADPYCLCYRLKRMRGIWDGFTNFVSTHRATIVLTILHLHYFFVFFLDLLESGINTSRMRQKWWRMCLVGRLVKVCTILGDGCPQLAVSCVLISGDVFSAISIRICAASCMFVTFWYFCPVSKINFIWNICDFFAKF